MSVKEHKVGGFCGILAAILYLIVMMIPAPGGSYDAADVAEFVSGDGRAMNVAAVFLGALWLLLFLAFLASLVQRIREADAVRWDWLANVALGAGIAHATLTVAGWDLVRSVPVGVALGGAAAPAPEVTYILGQAGWGMVLVLGAFAGMALVAATVLLAVRDVFPKWLLWLGIVTILALAFGVIFLPMIMWVAWLLAVSAWLFMPAKLGEDRTADMKTIPA